MAIAKPIIALFASVAGFGATPALALECEPKFDRNGNGFVEAGRELDVCIIHASSPLHRQYDKNLDGGFNDSENGAMKDGLRQSADFVVTEGDVLDAVAGTPGLKVTSKPKTAKAEPTSDDYAATGGFLVRSAYEAAGVLNQPKTDLSKVSGAQISFVHSFEDDNFVGSASGIVEAYRSWTLNPKDSDAGPLIAPGSITDAAVHIGAEFNRKIDGANPAKEIDSLTLRTGGEIAMQGLEDDFHFFRANLFDATDFDFGAHVVGGEAEWEPVYLTLGIGVARQVTGLPVYYRWRPVLHAEYQHVLDDGGSAALASASDFLFAGPVISGELWFGGALERLYFDAKYWAMWDALGEADPFQYLEVGANWALDADGHFALTAKYRNGNVPKTREPVEDITLGLTAKF